MENFEYVNMTLGQNIARARKENKLSQADLSRKLDMSQTIISQWERGEREASLSMIWRIADVLNVPVTSLLPISYSGILDDETVGIAERISSDPKWREVFQIIDFMPAQKREALFAMIKAMKE